VIAALIGRVFEVRADAVLVDVHGVVYQVMTSGRTVAAAGEVGSDITVQTRLIVRDDAQVLYGFLHRAELQWFESLINVSGIGPRLACAMLTRFSPEELLTVIEAENVALLSTVPGIGKRTASRILLDLRGKLPADLTTTTAGSLPRLAAGRKRSWRRCSRSAIRRTRRTTRRRGRRWRRRRRSRIGSSPRCASSGRSGRIWHLPTDGHVEP